MQWYLPRDRHAIYFLVFCETIVEVGYHAHTSPKKRQQKHKAVYVVDKAIFDSNLKDKIGILCTTLDFPSLTLRNLKKNEIWFEF